MADTKVTQEEIQAELDAMEKAGKHHTPKSARKRRVSTRTMKWLLIIVLVIAILLSMFVWISGLQEDYEEAGYIINVDELGNIDGSSSSLELAFDPTFSDHYMQLVGLGYGDVSSLKGGSLFEGLGADKNGNEISMFKKFSDFAKNDEAASQYEGNKGSANFDQYYCNKYYLRNTGDQTVYYRLNLKVTQNLNGALHAARFMIVTEDNQNPGRYDYQIFATANKETFGKEVAAYKNIKSATTDKEYFTDPNKSDINISSRDIKDAWMCDLLTVNPETGYYNFVSGKLNKNNDEITKTGEWYKLEPGQSTCYTICVWFEGSDPEHNDSIIGGGISFTINYETEDYVNYIEYVSKKDN